MVPVDALALIITHAGKEYATGLSLLDYVLNDLGAPVIVLPVVQGVTADIKRLGGTEDNAAVAVNTVLAAASYLIVPGVIVMHIKGALTNAHLALDAPLGVPFY
jgi:hypothetical protein